MLSRRLAFDRVYTVSRVMASYREREAWNHLERGSSQTFSADRVPFEVCAQFPPQHDDVPPLGIRTPS